MSKINVFSTVIFPLLAAPANGRGIQYIANIEIEEKEKTKSIPIIGKVGITQFFIGLCYESLFILLLLPFRKIILSIFCEDGFEMKDKWDAYVLASSLIALVVIAFIVSIKFLIVGKKIDNASKHQAKRDSSTIKNLTK